MKIDKQISREIGVHGKLWNAMHDGYFSNSIIARPLIATISQYLSGSNTDVLVDLGGGTGFILLELIAQSVTQNMVPVNLDYSATQLDAMEQSGISCINGLISDFSRNDLATFGKRISFIMRSVLHYFGKDGLIPVLSHIRDQARTGELFIHQTACFENAPEAQCLNVLYQEMDTPKWYPTINELRDGMANTNWQVIEICPAPPLKLSSVELGRRYGLKSQSLERICGRIMEEFGEINHVFQQVPGGFVAYLHYRIYVAKAA
ncbi:MAG TPA: hypothetical protein VMU29_04160 [Smithella sp.]|nr:hypothetical protein [Smithella sp.]